jgi:adenylate cyclase
VREMIVAEELQPITMKGISREVVPYTVRDILGAAGETIQVFSEHVTGLDFYLNTSMVDINAATHVRKVLQDALNALDKNVAAHTNMTDAGHAGSEHT